MSATTQTGEATRPITNGNGHATRKARGPNKAKAKAKAKAPATAAPMQTAAGVTAAAAQPTARITPIPIAGGGSMISWLRDRLNRLDIERQTIQSLIAAAGPQRMATPGTTRKAPKKRRAKRQQTMKQAA